MTSWHSHRSPEEVARRRHIVSAPRTAGSPIKLFWSVTLYDVDTRALIRNEQKIADRSSRMDLRMNEDGSVDIYCGAEGSGRLRKELDSDLPWQELVRVFQLLPADPGLFRSVVAVDRLPANLTELI